MAVVYSHNKPCGEVFYVGIGNEEKRAYSLANRNQYWKNTVAKYGYEIKIVSVDLSYEEAKELEIFMIDFYGRKDKGKGTLVNMTDGGDGMLGFVKTPESIEKWRKSKKHLRGKDHPSFGKKRTEEQKQRAKEARKKYICSEETKRKLKESNRSAEYTGRKVICIDTLQIWDSIRLCQIELNIPSLANYLNPDSETKNRTSIQYLEDYEKGIITCKQEVKQHKKSILNVNTGEVYTSFQEATSNNLGADRNTLAKHFKKGDEFVTRFGFHLKLITS